MCKTFVTTVLLAIPFATAAAAQGAPCPFSGIATSSFGVGTGVCANSVLTASLDTSACRIDFAFAPEPVGCGNVVLTQNALLLGTSQLPAGIPLGPSFLPGSELLIAPLVLLGPFPGATTSLTVPGDPGLIGATAYFQSVPVFFSSFPFPGSSSVGTSTGLRLTFS